MTRAEFKQFVEEIERKNDSEEITLFDSNIPHICLNCREYLSVNLQSGYEGECLLTNKDVEFDYWCCYWRHKK